MADVLRKFGNFFFGLLRNKIVSFELSKVNVLNNELKLFKECHSLVNLFGTGVWSFLQNGTGDCSSRNPGKPWQRQGKHWESLLLLIDILTEDGLSEL